MINARDLMTGNWVRVEAEDYNGFYDVTMIEDGDVLGEAQPIPITEKLLKRIGFVKQENYFRLYYYYKDGFVLEADNALLDDGEWFVQVDDSRFESIGSGYVDSLHRLQNLVRVITGKDLPITEEMLDDGEDD